MDLKIPDFTKDIDFESTPLKNIEKASTETAVQAKHLAHVLQDEPRYTVHLNRAYIVVFVFKNLNVVHSLTPFFLQLVHLQPLPSF